MEFRPVCAIPGCGGLGIYRCGECRRTFCGRHASVVSNTAEHAVEGPWRVRCATCRLNLSAEPPWWDRSSVDWVEAESAPRRLPADALQDKESGDATAG